MEIKGCAVSDWMQQSSCKVIVKGQHTEGSGFLCSGYGHIITAGHLFLESKHDILNEKNCEDAMVYFVGFEPVKASILIAQRDDKQGVDFAVLKMEKIFQELRPFSLDLLPEIGQEIKIYGFGTNFNQTSTVAYGRYEGEAISINGGLGLLKLNAQNAIQHGYSGSAVVSTKSGAVVGIQTEASTIIHGADNSTVFAMPIKRVLELFPTLYNFVAFTSSKFSIYKMKHQVILYRDLRREDNDLF